MEIRELNLVAFGPFTDKKLIFDQDKAGVYVIYGPNEAGKSSALRGLKSLLYGIAANTADNFIHDYQTLRIGGCLRASNGEELRFFRRKGNKNTLLAPDDTPLDDMTLSTFLPGVSADVFNTLFGIDHYALESGGAEILKQKGEVGKALFAAALGTPALHSILEGFDNEADALFRPRGSTQKINVAVKRFNDLKKDIRDASLSSTKWDEHRRALARTTQALTGIQTELKQNRAKLSRLQRIRRVLPKFAQRRESGQKLESMGKAVVLAGDFSKRRQNIVTELDTAQAVKSHATSRLDDLQQQLDDINVSKDILNQAETIEALHERLGSHRKAMQDRPGLVAERAQLHTDVEALLKETRPGLPIDDIEELRPVLTKRARIIELGNKQGALVDRAKRAEKELRNKVLGLEELQDTRRELPDVKSSGALNNAITAARRAGNLDKEVTNSNRQLNILEEQCTTELKRLPLWQGNLSGVLRLSVPASESIDRFEQEYETLNSAIQRLQENKEKLTATGRNVEKSLDELQRTGTVPTEQDLEQARARRNLGWRLLRRKWLDNQDVQVEAKKYDSERPLPDAYESRMHAADDLADRLRREADRVQKLASLTASRDDCKYQTEEVMQQLNARDALKTDVDTKWTELWKPCEFEPQTPREMRRWLDDFEKLRDKIVQLEETRGKTTDLISDRYTHIKDLARELQALGKIINDAETSLESVLQAAEEKASEIQNKQQHREQLDNEIITLKQEIKTARFDNDSASRELEAWKNQWKDVMAQLNLESEASPAEANDVVEKLRQLFTNLKDAEQLDSRIQGINDDANAFQLDVKKLIDRVAPNLSERPVEQTMADLRALLTLTRTDASRHNEIQVQIQQAKQEIQQANTTINTMTERLKDLCAEAHCQSADQLDETQRLSDEFQRLQSTIETLEREILEAGEGGTLLELENEIENVDPDNLPGELQALNDHINNELEPRQTELAEEKGRQRIELELMDGSDKAAQLNEQARSELAQVQGDSERYIQLKLASRILRREIEQYRSENQDPLVKRASEYFSILTNGSYTTLRTDYNEKDESILVGVKVEDDTVKVECMSSGARDQLYLALRLASLEKYMESSEPMPFIVDDVLINFDDERTTAALKSLSALAQNTQVILFTHHTKTVELSQNINAAVNLIEL